MIPVLVEASYEDIVAEVKFYMAYMKVIPDIYVPNYKPLPDPDPIPDQNPDD